MSDTIGTKLIVSSIFDPYFYVTNSGEMVDISRNSEVMSDVIVVVLEAEYCSHTFNYHIKHCDKDTAWYDYVDINSINMSTHYEPLPATEEILNDIYSYLLFSSFTGELHVDVHIPGSDTLLSIPPTLVESNWSNLHREKSLSQVNAQVLRYATMYSLQHTMMVQMTVLIPIHVLYSTNTKIVLVCYTGYSDKGNAEKNCIYYKSQVFLQQFNY